MTDSYQLYGTPFSLYTGKVRAYLTYKNIPFEEVFSSMTVFRKVIVPRTGARFIPIVRTPEDEYLQDTAVIIDTLEKRHPERPILPETPRQRLVSHLLECWADQWLLIPAMHYRWNKEQNFPSLFHEFGNVVVPNFTPEFIRRFVGKQLGSKFRGYVPQLGITDRTIPEIEDWYENEILRTMEEHFATHDYLLGGAPTLGDFCLMGPMYAHLYRDPGPGDFMREKAPHVAAWVERMNSPCAKPGTLLPSDTIPETVLEILKHLFKDFWPVLESSSENLDSWCVQNLGKLEIPRFIGKHSFTIGEVTETRFVIPFNVWKMQRVLNCYNQLQKKDKQSLDNLLFRVDGFNCMQFKIKQRVKLDGSVLRLALKDDHLHSNKDSRL